MTGVGAIGELGLDSGSAIVEAKPCAVVRSTIRRCPIGVENGLAGRERFENCRCTG